MVRIRVIFYFSLSPPLRFTSVPSAGIGIRARGPRKVPPYTMPIPCTGNDFTVYHKFTCHIATRRLIRWRLTVIVVHCLDTHEADWCLYWSSAELKGLVTDLQFPLVPLDFNGDSFFFVIHSNSSGRYTSSLSISHLMSSPVSLPYVFHDSRMFSKSCLSDIPTPPF